MRISFRLATFNLENLDWSTSHDEEFERRHTAFAPILRELSADILCLQEIDAQKRGRHGDRRFIALDRLLSGGPYESFHRTTSVRPGTAAPADVHNLAILSRWPIVEHKQLFHEIVSKWTWTPPGGDAAQSPIVVSFDRPLLYAKITLPDGAPLHVLNLHLRAPRAVPLHGGDDRLTPGTASRAFAEGQFLAAQKREAQALEARLFVDRLFDSELNARIAVCGDFNSQEHDAPARILRGARDEDTPRTSPRMLVSLTERVAKEERYSVLHNGRPILLDNILASARLSEECSDARILNAGLQDEVLATDPIVGSLHAPVMASFDLGS